MPPKPDDILARVEKGLWAPLPGIPAQLAMAPEPRTGHKAYFEVEDTSRKAGVLVLLYVKDRRLCVLLTRRTERVLHHRGQISFPGGEQHPGESLEATALRETVEEMGLDLTAVRVLGRLTPLYIPPSNYCIYPTVAFIAGPSRLPCPARRSGGGHRGPGRPSGRPRELSAGRPGTTAAGTSRCPSTLTKAIRSGGPRPWSSPNSWLYFGDTQHRNSRFSS